MTSTTSCPPREDLEGLLDERLSAADLTLLGPYLD